MKTYMGLSLVTWGLLVIGVLPDSPRLMNYVVMGVYGMAILWWLGHDSPADFLYWCFAFGITAVVTWGFMR